MDDNGKPTDGGARPALAMVTGANAEDGWPCDGSSRSWRQLLELFYFFKLIYAGRRFTMPASVEGI
jgi:hypothetical protein